MVSLVLRSMVFHVEWWAVIKVRARQQQKHSLCAFINGSSNGGWLNASAVRHTNIGILWMSILAPIHRKDLATLRREELRRAG